MINPVNDSLKLIKNHLKQYSNLLNFFLIPSYLNRYRQLSKVIKQRLKNEYHTDGKKLIRDLLKLLIQHKITTPFHNPMVSLLKEQPKMITNYNLQVLANDCYATYNNFSELYYQITKPKSNCRQMGQTFIDAQHIIMPNLPETTNIKKFMSTKRDMVFNPVSDHTKQVIAEKLGYPRISNKRNDNKGVDLVARVNDVYYIGEQKFITASGGSQSHQWKDGMDTALAKFHSKKYHTKGMFIVDGAPLLDAINPKSYNKNKKSLYQNRNKLILSAFMLKPFFDEQIKKEFKDINKFINQIANLKVNLLKTLKNFPLITKRLHITTGQKLIHIIDQRILKCLMNGKSNQIAILNHKHDMVNITNLYDYRTLNLINRKAILQRAKQLKPNFREIRKHNIKRYYELTHRNTRTNRTNLKLITSLA